MASDTSVRGHRGRRGVYLPPHPANVVVVSKVAVMPIPTPYRCRTGGVATLARGYGQPPITSSRVAPLLLAGLRDARGEMPVPGLAEQSTMKRDLRPPPAIES